MPSIYYACPDISRPVGGIKQIYRHVDILNRRGFSACVAHEQPGFRCDWFENSTRVTSIPEVLSQAGPQLDGYVVLPEVSGARMKDAPRGRGIVVFNQNCYYTFLDYPLQERSYVPYLDEDVLATMVVSEDSEAYLRFVFPRLKVVRIHPGIDPEIFRGSPVKKKRIAFLANKNVADLTQVINILRIRGTIEGYELVPLAGMPESELAAVLSETGIFLSVSHREGFFLPAAEAMACGCIVVGYHGGGAREYMRPELSYPVADGDILGLVSAVEEVAAALESSPESMAEKARAASRFIRDHYSLAREEREVVEFWAGVSGMR